MPDGIVHSDRAAVAHGRNVLQLRFKAKLIFEFIIFMNFMRLDILDFSGAVRQIQQALIPKLELAHIAIRNQICLANRGIRFKAQLSRLHHRTQERLRRTLL